MSIHLVGYSIQSPSTSGCICDVRRRGGGCSIVEGNDSLGPLGCLEGLPTRPSHVAHELKCGWMQAPSYKVCEHEHLIPFCLILTTGPDRPQTQIRLVANVTSAQPLGGKQGGPVLGRGNFHDTRSSGSSRNFGFVC